VVVVVVVVAVAVAVVVAVVVVVAVAVVVVVAVRPNLDVARERTFVRVARVRDKGLSRAEGISIDLFPGHRGRDRPLACGTCRHTVARQCLETMPSRWQGPCKASPAWSPS
jgi:hypothetical protein